MDRRTFLMASSGAVLVAGSASAVGIDYTAGLVRSRLKAGETVFLDFAADWCSTCARQERVIASLLQENPAYGAVTFIRVDWDEYGRSKLAQDLRIPRRSTLVVLKGNQELGRIVAGTGRRDIQKLMDVALSATKS